MKTKHYCSYCGKETETLRPVTGVHHSELVCKECYEEAMPKINPTPIVYIRKFQEDNTKSGFVDGIS